MTSSATPAPLSYVSIGPYSRLYSEDFFIQALAPLGITRRSFRALLRSLSVPTIEIGRTRLIDHISLALAFRAILRIGEPDFLAPTSSTLRRGKVPTNTRTTLSNEDFLKNHSLVMAELLLAHRTTSLTAPTALRSAALEASRRMLLAGLQSASAAEQTDYARRALRVAKHEGLDSATSDSQDTGLTDPTRPGRGSSTPRRRR